MIWNFILVIVPLFIARFSNYTIEPDELKHENYETILKKLNARSLTKIICGVFSILVLCTPILDFFLKPSIEQIAETNSQKSSPIFHFDYVGDGLFPFVIAAGVLAIGWLIYIATHLKYREQNNEKLAHLLNEAEKERIKNTDKLVEKQRENERFITELTAEYGTPDKVINLGSTDPQNAFIVFPQTRHIYTQGKTIPFSQIIGCEVKDDCYSTKEGTIEQVMTSNTGSTIGRAIVGGLVAGPAGAIIGGTTSKKKTEVKDNTKIITHHHYYVLLTLADISNPMVKIDCGDVSPEKAEAINAIIFGIIRKTRQNTTEANNEKVLIADELLKLAELKEKGILTQQEFDQEKQRLLARNGDIVEEDKSTTNNLLG